MILKPQAIIAATVALATFGLASAVFSIQSPSYGQAGRLPKQLTCDGVGLSPELVIKNPPKATKSFAILGWDDNTNAAPLSTWEVYDIPSDTKKIAAGIGNNLPNFKQGLNSFGHMGFSAPCPIKDGKLREYYIDFYALNVVSLGLPAGAPAAAVHAAIKQHKIAEAKLLGVYSRK